MNVTSTASIIIINFGKSDLVLQALESIARSDDVELIGEAIVVDNKYPEKGDSRDTVDGEAYPFPVRFVRNPESGYASGVNRGAALASQEILIIANNDIEFLNGHTILPLLEHLDHNTSVGIVGPQLLFPDGSWQRSYGNFPSLVDVGKSLVMFDSISQGVTALAFARNLRARAPRSVDCIDGAFMAVKSACFQDLAGFDEKYQFYVEDVDFCYRAQKRRWRVDFVPAAHVMHIRGASSRAEAIQDYFARLFVAKVGFVRDYRSLAQARLYAFLYKVAMFERVVLFSLLSIMPAFRRQARGSRLRFQAIASLRGITEP